MGQRTASPLAAEGWTRAHHPVCRDSCDEHLRRPTSVDKTDEHGVYRLIIFERHQVPAIAAFSADDFGAGVTVSGVGGLKVRVSEQQQTLLSDVAEGKAAATLLDAAVPSAK